MVVIHYTAMASARAAAETLCNPKTEVSAHYLIAQDGEVISLVPEALRAWHAGVGRWGAVKDVNSRSIGIELANTGSTPFAAAQMDALIALLQGIFQRWGMRPERVIGHSDMAPGRKIDPGVHFDWRRLAVEGVSVWPQPGLVALGLADQAQFLSLCRIFGYTATVDQSMLLDTFRRRFRPWAKGPLDTTDIMMMSDLAQRFPVDVNAAWV
ncbi:MAG: N-acetylmuramoyl-L-alanine amidase [Pseudomonadota bacterium]